MGKKLFEVCQNLEGISVASYFHVYENEDAVSHYKEVVFSLTFQVHILQSICKHVFKATTAQYPGGIWSPDT
jgi:hypothetical protein